MAQNPTSGTPVFVLPTFFSLFNVTHETFFAIDLPIREFVDPAGIGIAAGLELQPHGGAAQF